MLSIGTRARRVFPWVTPVLAAAEVALVLTGVVRPAHAVIVFIVVELAIAVFGVGSVIAAGRAYRRSARAGNRRAAAITALESVLPRGVARAVMIEAQAWRAFALCLRRRRLADSEFSYGADLRPLLFMVIGVLVVEGVVVEFVVGLMFGHGWWLWLLAGLHLYALCWLVGIAASLRTLPHQVGTTSITLRDSIFGEYQLPIAQVADVQTVRTANTGRSGLLIDPGSGHGRLCHGDGTLVLALTDDTTIGGRSLQQLAMSVDRPAAFAAACRAVMPPISHPKDTPC